jgi:hypothetical protein
MKRFSSSIFWALAKVCALLATLIGCSSESTSDKPREIRWKGQETGFWGTTTVPPAERDGSDSKK